MSAFPPAFLEHLRRDCTTLCHCWLVARADGRLFGFTDHDRPLVVAGVNYEPESGFAQSEARIALGLSVDTVDVEGALASEALAEADIAAGLFDGAGVETLLVNWADPGQFATIRRAVIGRIVRADGRFVAELESVAANLDRPSGRSLRRTCDARLGDARCGVNVASHTASGTVLGPTAPATLLVLGLQIFETGWFSSGEVTWANGNLAGRTSAVVDHRKVADGSLLVLPASAPMPGIGDAFTIVAGCDKRFATCKAKFANALNFRGFPHLPGNDAAYGYVTDSGIFDGGPVVP